MTTTGILSLVAIALGIAWLMWRMATIKTDPEGYSRIATYTDKGEVRQASRVLGNAGIRYQLDDHSSHPQGTRVRILVETGRFDEATRLLEHVAIKHKGPDADREGEQ
jgi:hypothetical protein